MDIITLLKANLKHKKGNFISIILLMLIISTMLTAVISIKTNLGISAKKAHEEVKTGDFVVLMDKSMLTDEMLSDIKNSECVSSVDQKKALTIYSMYLNGKEFKKTYYLVANDYKNYPYNIFNKSADGFLENEKDLKDNEILLPIVMRKTCNCEIGDKVVLDIPDYKNEFTIAGFIQEPFMGSDIMGAKQFIISPNTFNALDTLSGIKPTGYAMKRYLISSSMLNIFASDDYKDRFEDVAKILNEKCELLSLSTASLTVEDCIDYTLLISNIFCGVLIAFCGILLLIVILVLSNSIRTSIDTEYVNIGILKSQGFSKNRIRLVFLIQYVLAALIGSAVGIALSTPVIRILRKTFIQTTGLLFSDKVCLVKSMLIIASIIVLLGLIIHMKTAKISKVSPITAISGGLENVYFKSIIQTPVISEHKAFINTRLGLRQLTSNIRQYTGTCFIFSLLVLFMCLSASFNQTFTAKYFNEIFGVKVADVVVDYNDNLSLREDIEKTISQISPIKESFYYGDMYFLIDGYQNNTQVLDDMSYLNFIKKGRAPEYDNEIVITNRLSAQLKKDIGDKVEIASKNTKRQYVITGIYDSCSEVGQCFSMTYEGAKKLTPDLIPNTRNYIIEDSSKVSQIINAISAKYPKEDNIKATQFSALDKNTIDTVLMGSDIMIYLIYIVSVVFTIIVVAMVCGKAFIKEQHDLGIYKAFGFSSSSLRLQFCIRFLFVTIIGGIIGITVCVLFGNKLISSILSIVGVTNFKLTLTFFNLGLPFLIICVFVLLSSYIVMKKIKNVDTKCLIVE